MFEAGDPNQPVYIGSMYAKGSSMYQPMGTVDDDDNLSKRYVDSNGRWNRPAYQSEVPAESFSSGSDYENSRITIYKSPKGATIEMEEEDEKESFSIIDRLGQILKFMSPVTKESNSYNAHRRYNKRADYENQYDTERISVAKKSVILLKDARNQFLRFVAKKGSSKVELMSKDENSSSLLNLQSGDGYASFVSEYENNRVYLKLDAKNLSSKIVVESNGKVISEVSLSDNIVLDSQGAVSISQYQCDKTSDYSWNDTKDEMDDNLVDSSSSCGGDYNEL